MQRVLIISCSGSGKTSYAHRLAKQTGLPIIHLDQEYFGPDWTEPRQADWQQTVAQLAARDRWIMDGNFSATLPLRLPRADTIIFLDQPTRRCIWRVIKRTARFHGQVRPGAAPGCRERFDIHFFRYVMRYNESRRPGILRMLARQEALGTRVHILRSARPRDL
jgi:adenylate kinase family enzyme